MSAEATFERAGPSVIGRLWTAVGPVATVVAVIIALWYAAVIPMNILNSVNAAARDGIEVVPESRRARSQAGRLELTFANPDAWSYTLGQERPALPAPHEVASALWSSVSETALTAKTNIVHHVGVTVSATLLGFVFGTGLGILLAVGIVYVRAMDMAAMPWVIASQTIPILALAPMIITIFGAMGIHGLLPKAVIATYLSFFPVVVGMVKGLRSPDAMQLDLLRTYNAGGGQEFWKLRVPAAMPFLFASLKVGIAASLVGTIVGELPTGAEAGLGARLLQGLNFGPYIQIWVALFAAALTAAALVGLISLAERLTLRRMGMAAV